MTETITSCTSKKSPHGFLLRLVAGALLIDLFVVALASWSLYQSRCHYEDRVLVLVQNLSQALNLSIGNLLDKSDLALLAVVDEAEQEIAAGGIDGPVLNRFIARQHARVPELEGFRMTDSRGDVLFGTGVQLGSRVNNADRTFFLRARDDAGSGPFISRPLVGRIARKWVVNIARRVNRPDGSFAGVAYGSLSIDYLQRLFATLDIGRRGSITLRDDGLAVVARYPAPRGVDVLVGNSLVTPRFRRELAKDPATGTFTAHAAIDRIERTFSYRKVARYPLYVVVGRSTEDYLAGWWQETVKILLLAALFVIGTLVSASQIYLRWTGKMQAQEELHRSHEQLEALVRDRTAELEAFNYTVSHDLRRPLTVINTYCQVILELWEGRLDRQCREYVEGARDETLRMDRLIDDLLNFSRMTSRELHRETVDLSPMVQQYAAGVAMTLPDRRLSFQIARGVQADGDPQLLQMVLDNILSNAVKFTGAREEAVIEFGVRNSPAQAVYFVRDNGVGLDMQCASELFTPFWRMPGADAYPGYGIGLATVERIIKRHGGRVWAEGEPGKGATFYFTL